MVTVKYIKGKVRQLVTAPHTTWALDEMVTLTIRVVADEFERDPYGCVTMLNRYLHTTTQFERPEND